MKRYSEESLADQMTPDNQRISWRSFIRRRLADIKDQRREGDQSERLRALGWWHSFTLPHGENIEGVRSEAELATVLDRFDLSRDLSGKRILDVGAWDGWFSFEMERRGATVTAVDCWENPHFHHVRHKLGSSVEYIQADVYELTPDKVGRFDIVLFLGVLYHLKHPLLALERVCALSSDRVLVESFVTDERMPTRKNSIPSMEFYETDELSGQTDNWIGPSADCLLAFCRTAGFVQPFLHTVQDHRAYLTCYRRWSDLPLVGSVSLSLEKAVHSRNGGINFDSPRDEYVTAWFRTSARLASRESVMPSVGGYGSVPIYLGKTESDGKLWEVCFKLPPGLSRGYHPVHLRLATGESSNSTDVAVDVQETAGTVVIAGACDGKSWESAIIRGSENGRFCVSIWVTGLPRNADRNSVIALVNGKRCAPAYVQAHGGAEEARQINIESSLDKPGECVEICIVSGSQTSQPVLLTSIGFQH